MFASVAACRWRTRCSKRSMKRLTSWESRRAGSEDAELHELVVAVQRERARLGALAAAPAGSLGCPPDLGRGRLPERRRPAVARDGLLAGHAGVEMRRARQQRELPATMAAIGRGELSLDHIDLLGRANQAHRTAHLARDEAFLVEQCTRLRFASATRVVEYWCQRVDAEAEPPRARRRDLRRHPSPCGGDHGRHGRGQRGAGPGRRLGGAGRADRLEHELYLAEQRDGTTRTAAARRAAALVVMAQRSATTPADGRPPRPLFSVLLGDAAFTDLCEMASGTVITPRQLVPWLDTADLETILFDGPSTVVSVSHRRTFTGAVRRAIQVRDRHCQHPAGCDVPANRCDVDHIVPHCQGGETSQFNGRLECPTHNRHADRHDHDAIPFPARPLTRLDELRGRIRWRVIHDECRDSSW